MQGISPLQYPGSKLKLINELEKYIPNGTRNIISPFLGGGSFEIYLANKGYSVQAFDIIEPLINFWKYILNDSVRLYDEIMKYFPLSKEKYYEIREILRNHHSNTLENAAYFFALNRSSFGGGGLAAGMIKNHPSFTKSSIDFVKIFQCTNLKVNISDFEESLYNIKNEFIYLDPPYMLENGNTGGNYLYGNKGHAHRYFDHHKLYKILKNKSNWMMSYNNSEKIKKLYSEYKIIEININYSMKHTYEKKSKEIIIFSKEE